jgi:hypothetical protein
MKNLLRLTILLLITSTSCGGMLTTTILYPEQKSKIVNIENTNKSNLFVRANNWMVETFNDAESVIQFADKENGIVTGKYLMQTIIKSTSIPAAKVFAIIKIRVKDNAANIEILPDSYVNSYNPWAGGKSFPLEDANLSMEVLMNSFEKYIKTKEKDF